MTTIWTEQLRTRSSEKLSRLTNELVMVLVTSGFQEVDSFVAIVNKAHEAYKTHVSELDEASLVRLNGLIGNLRAKLLGEALKPVPITVILARELNKINTHRTMMTVGAAAFLSGIHPNLSYEKDWRIKEEDLVPPEITPAVVELINEYLELVQSPPLSTLREDAA